MQFLVSGSGAYSTVSNCKSMLHGWTFQAFKTSRSTGYLIKGPSGQQC